MTNLGLENYVKESRERLLTAAISVDIDLFEPIRKTAIEAKKQKNKLKNTYNSAPTTILRVVGGKLNAKNKSI